jgi:uncharacterized membrane protein
MNAGTPSPTNRVTEDAEQRWPSGIAIILALVLYGLMPASFQILPGWTLSIIGIALLIPLLVYNPRQLARETRASRMFSIGYSLALTAINQVYVVITIHHLLNGTANGGQVLLTTLEVWITNVIAFGLVFWQLDSGGPIARRGGRNRGRIDFRFPQQEDGNTSKWRPRFIDYLYFSLSNMMAFSPTDTMPLSGRAKLAMGYQALTGFILLALVISRAVNILN